MHCPVSMQWISSALSDASHLSYWTLNREHEILCANSHFVQAVAASLAEMA